MRHRFAPLIIFSALLITPISFAQANIDTALDEANSNFTYKGQPIHPGLVEEFSSWLSDPGMPTTIAVDIAAEHGNEYYEDAVKIQENGFVSNEKDGGGAFSYKRLGTMANGLHVLQISDTTMGSGIFGQLFFVKFDRGHGYSEDGKPYDRLLMSIVRKYTLGDRDDGEINVLPDRVIISKSRYRDQETVIKFD